MPPDLDIPHMTPSNYRAWPLNLSSWSWVSHLARVLFQPSFLGQIMPLLPPGPYLNVGLTMLVTKWLSKLSFSLVLYPVSLPLNLETFLAIFMNMSSILVTIHSLDKWFPSEVSLICTTRGGTIVFSSDGHEPRNVKAQLVPLYLVGRSAIVITVTTYLFLHYTRLSLQILLLCIITLHWRCYFSLLVGTVWRIFEKECPNVIYTTTTKHFFHSRKMSGKTLVRMRDNSRCTRTR